MGKSLSHLSSEASQKTNVPGETTPILTFEPDNGTVLRLLNRVSQGSAAGIPVFMDLNNYGGGDLPTDTKMIFRVLRPTDDEPIAVSVAEYNIAPFNSLTTSQQRNSDNIDSVKVELKADRVNVRDSDELRVEINSSQEIRWGYSEFYFARAAVEEFSED